MTNLTAPAALRIDRTAPGDYVARNDRGAELRVGAKTTDGTFTPGELLQLALAACTLLSADHTLSHKLGDGFAAGVDVSATKHDEDNRYEHMLVRLTADMDDLDAAAKDALVARAAAVIKRQCTVGNTLGHDEPMAYDIEITPAD